MVTKVVADAPILAVSVPAAAKMAGISRSLMFALIAAGEGPRTFKIRKRTLIYFTVLDAWLEQMAAA
jgi:predicted DNA-binding transcriptional regulator AlpA